MTCRRVITGFSTQTLHSFFKGEIPEIFPATFRHSFFDPLKLLPHGSEAKAIHSHLVAPPNSPSVWVSKFQPRFWVDFFGGLNFQTQLEDFGGPKNAAKDASWKKYLYEMFSRSTIHCANKVSLVFQVCYLYPFWGKPFWGKPVSIGNVYNLKYTNLHQKKTFRWLLPGRRSSWRSQLFSRTSWQPGKNTISHMTVVPLARHR